MNCLTGPAALLLWDSEDATFDQLSEKLLRRYGSREQQEKFRVELRYRRRRNGESLQELAQDIERLTALAYPAVDQTLLDTLGCDAFIDALNNPALEFKIREKEPGSLNAALTLSMKLEVLHKAREMQKESAKPKYVRAAQSNESEQPKDPPVPETVDRHGGGSDQQKGAREKRQSMPNYQATTRTQLREIQDLKGEVQRLTEELNVAKATLQQQPAQPVTVPQQYHAQQQTPYYPPPLMSIPLPHNAPWGQPSPPIICYHCGGVGGKRPGKSPSC